MTPADAAGPLLHSILADERPSRRRVREERHVAANIAALYDGAVCRIWYGDELRNEIVRGLGAEVATAFDQLSVHGGRGTLASWCILHMFGGTIHHHSLRVLAPVALPAGHGIAAFNDVRHPATGWTDIETALLRSLPNRPEWALAIDMKVAAWRRSPAALPSDRTILGHAFAASATARGERSDDDLWIGQVRSIPAGADGDHHAFVTPDGTIAALRGG